MNSHVKSIHLPQPRRRPNVIVFFTDQQRWDAAGVHGNPLDLMPNFDRMATHGTHPACAFTPAPVCGPARACLQTGTHISTNQVYHNGPAPKAGLPTLAECFNAAGYDTGYIGKWHIAGAGQPADRVKPENRGGYQYWLGANGLEAVSDAYDCIMYDTDGNEVKMPGYRSDAQTDAAIRYINTHQQNPFFLFLSYIEPHFQNHLDDYPPPVGYREKYTTNNWAPPDLAMLGGTMQQHLAGYWGMIKRLDEGLGRIFDALKSLRLEQDTIVLFTSDHGCHFKTRNREYKRSCHDSSIRVPTAITGPGFNGGGRFENPFSLVDVAPTLLDACDIPIPEQMEGHSALALLRGKGESADWPEEMFVQVCDDPTMIGRAVRTHRWKYCVTTADANAKQQGGSAHYTETHLYDLHCDPYELRNLIDQQSHEKVCNVMKARLLARMKAVGEPEPVITSAQRVPSGQRRVSDEEAQM
jgi:arylsulfatase A-like enzyme